MTDIYRGLELANRSRSYGPRRLASGLGLIAFGVGLLFVFGKFVSPEALIPTATSALIVFICPGLLLILAGLIELVFGQPWSKLSRVTRIISLVLGIPIISVLLVFGAGITADLLDQMRATPNSIANSQIVGATLLFLASLFVLPLMILLVASVPEFVVRLVLFVPNKRRTFREDIASLTGFLSGWIATLHIFIWYGYFFGRPVFLLPVLVILTIWLYVATSRRRLLRKGKHCNPFWGMSLALGVLIGFVIYTQRYFSNNPVDKVSPVTQHHDMDPARPITEVEYSNISTSGTSSRIDDLYVPLPTLVTPAQMGFTNDEWDRFMREMSERDRMRQYQKANKP